MATHSSISCLENSMDREALWATVHGVKKTWTWLSNWAHTHTHTHRHNELTRSKYFWSQLRFWKTVLAKKALAWTLNQIRSVAQSCPTLCDPMNCSMPGLPVHHQLQEFTQTHLHRVSDTIQPSHPLSSPSPPAPNPSQHQSLFQWVTSSHEVAKVLEFQL